MSNINFAALAAPIPKNAVKTLTRKYLDKKTKEEKTFTVSYITARTVMNRLDGVCGPANWYDEYKPHGQNSVLCTLYIRVNGEWIGKQDTGTETDIEEDKGAVSDALKRAAVKWGIGREIYGDGTVYKHLLAMEANADQQTGEIVPQSAQDTQGATEDPDPVQPDDDAPPTTWTRTTPLPEPQPAPSQAPDAEFVTIRDIWPAIAQQPETLKKTIADLTKLKFNIGGVVYPQAVLDALKYTDSDHVKTSCNLSSLKEFDGTLAELLETVIANSPRVTLAPAA